MPRAITTDPDMMKWVELLPEVIKNNVQVVDKDEFPQGTLYHISTNAKIPKFVPMVSARVANGEDNRVPRVCTAPTVLECMAGYGAVYRDFFQGKGNEAVWSVYRFVFDKAIKPTKKLLPDQKETNEHWLVTYSPETREYRADILGITKLTSVTHRYVDGVMTSAMELVVKVNGEEPILFSDGVLLGRGYHRVEVKNWYGCGNTVKDTTVESVAISRAEYQQYVKEQVALEHSVPSAHW